MQSPKDCYKLNITDDTQKRSNNISHLAERNSACQICATTAEEPPLLAVK